MLKVMTVNINHYGTKHGPWEMRRARLAGILRSQQPDLVALQAVAHNSKEDDQARQLANLCGYPTTIFEAVTEDEDGQRLGLAFLSRFPLALIGRVPLTHQFDPEDPGRRMLLWTRLPAANRSIYVINGHFSWVPALNGHNAADTAAFLAPLDGEALFVGDLNAQPDSAGMKHLAEAGFADVWASLCPGESGHTFESPAPGQRIDYAWANALMAERCEHIEIVSAKDGPYSDHLGLCITLR